jgi:hypothetical protein
MKTRMLILLQIFKSVTKNKMMKMMMMMMMANLLFLVTSRYNPFWCNRSLEFFALP